MAYARAADETKGHDMGRIEQRIAGSHVKIAIAALLAAFLLVAGLSGCNGSSKGESDAGNSATGDDAESISTLEVRNAKTVYEAIFLDNDEISNLFAKVRGETAPFDEVTRDFHVTTEYMPATTHPEWYGEKVTVHITAYAVQDVAADDGSTTSNEGFKAEVVSDNEELNEYLESLGKNYHITGAYKDGAKYTEYVDFSQGEPMDMTVTGTFGAGMSDNTIDLSGNVDLSPRPTT